MALFASVDRDTIKIKWERWETKNNKHIVNIWSITKVVGYQLRTDIDDQLLTIVLVKSKFTTKNINLILDKKT